MGIVQLVIDYWTFFIFPLTLFFCYLAVMTARLVKIIDLKALVGFIFGILMTLLMFAGNMPGWIQKQAERDSEMLREVTEYLVNNADKLFTNETRA